MVSCHTFQKTESLVGRFLWLQWQWVFTNSVWPHGDVCCCRDPALDGPSWRSCLWPCPVLGAPKSPLPLMTLCWKGECSSFACMLSVWKVFLLCMIKASLPSVTKLFLALMTKILSQIRRGPQSSSHAEVKVDSYLSLSLEKEDCLKNVYVLLYCLI